jgi:cellobiose phosphorylase
MKFGHFSDETREYVIHTPETPYPWINYLGNSSFFSLFSNTAGGYAFYKDARLRRLTRYRYNDVPLDNNGRYFYIKDESTVWNPGWKPMKTPLDFYECRHGFGYSKISSEKNNVRADVLYMIPNGENAEIQMITLTNKAKNEKNLSLVSFIEWCLYNALDDSTNFQRNFSIGEVEIDGGAIYHKTEYRERRDHFAFYSVNTIPDGFDTDRETFLGLNNNYDNPVTVTSGTSGNSVADGWAPIASHRINVTLKPGESRTLIFILGYVENDLDKKWDAHPAAGLKQTNPAMRVINKEKARIIQERFSTPEKVQIAFDELKTFWDGLLSRMF